MHWLTCSLHSPPNIDFHMKKRERTTGRKKKRSIIFFPRAAQANNRSARKFSSPPFPSPLFSQQRRSFPTLPPVPLPPTFRGALKRASVSEVEVEGVSGRLGWWRRVAGRDDGTRKVCDGAAFLQRILLHRAVACLPGVVAQREK